MEDFLQYLATDWVTVVGYLASILVAVTFTMKTMIPLRKVAIASNVVFITYAFFSEPKLYPILILHLAMFPLNIYRLTQMQSLIKKVKEAATGKFKFDFLIKYMTKEEFQKDQIIFNRGDAADKMYYIQAGNVRLTGLDVVLGPGAVLGEMGIFSPEGARTAQAKAASALTLYSIHQDAILQLYYQNPTFGFYLVQLMTKRFIEDLDHDEREVPDHSQPKDKTIAAKPAVPAAPQQPTAPTPTKPVQPPQQP